MRQRPADRRHVMDNEMHPPLREIGPAVADHFVARIDHGSSMLPCPPTGCLAFWGDTTNGERIPWGKPWDRQPVSGKLRRKLGVSPGFAAYFPACTGGNAGVSSPIEALSK